MVNILRLQQEIMREDGHIIEILEALNLEGIKEHDKYITFKNYRGDNASARVVYKDTLKYINWTRGDNGNIFTLVMQERKCGFGEALRWICGVTGIRPEKKNNVRYPFGGFYRKLLKDNDLDEDEDPYVYKESDLPPVGSLSKKFLDDGIPLITQEKWGVRYSHEDDAILIPIWGYMGELVGCKARSNSPHCPFDRRWWTYLSYRKSQYVYGWFENYRAIQKKETVIVVEAEKSVMVLDGWGCRLGLAIGGHGISKTQARYIKSLMPKKIVVAFDQGLDEEEVRAEAGKLAPRHRFMKTEVGYIFDKSGDVLRLDGKDAPVDLGIDKFKILMKEYVKWMD